MDLRQIINDANKREDQEIIEGLRTLQHRRQPYLRETSRLSNLMAGERGKVHQTPENLKAYEDASRELEKLEQEDRALRHRQSSPAEPIDPAPLLEQARRELEEERVCQMASVRLALRHRSVVYVQDFEQASKNIASLEPLVEAFTLAVEEQEVPA